MSSRRGQRLLSLVSAGGISELDRIPANQLRPVEVANVAGDIFTLKPAAELEPGEYVLCTAVPGGPGLNLCYSFGIR
jgi:hypothetical protein